MFCQLDEAIADFRAGKFLVLVDAQEREDEGDLILAAERVSTAKINRMLQEARGLLHLATTEAHLARLGVGLIEPHNADWTTPRFGLPFDAREGIETGVSAADRATSIQCALDPDTGPDGHCHSRARISIGSSPRGFAQPPGSHRRRSRASSSSRSFSGGCHVRGDDRGWYHGQGPATRGFCR